MCVCAWLESRKGNSRPGRGRLGDRGGVGTEPSAEIRVDLV